MVYLILSMLSSVAIANLLTWFNQDKRIDIYYIFAGNYLVASIFSWVTNKVSVSQVQSLDIYLGITAGIFFLVNFLIFQKNIAKNGQSVAVGVMRISLIIPTLLSIIVFAEALHFMKYLAILVIIAAFLRLSFTGHIKDVLLALVLFAITGVTDSFMKIYDELGNNDPGLYISILFTSALCITLLAIIFYRKKFNGRSILLGFLLGVPNQLTTKLFMASLTRLPASVAYPLLASGVVILALATDAGIWKRKFVSKELVAYALLLVGIVMLNIKW